MKPLPESLLRHPRIFRFDGRQPASTAALPTGWPELDACLPGGGWPRAALNEILVSRFGSGELQLVIPALAALGAEEGSSMRWLTWVSPPHIPYAPALVTAGLDLSRILVVRTRRSRDALWAAEQALRSGTCLAVLVWSEQADTRHLRRLQLAAEESGGWGIVFRPARMRATPSPAALRLVVSTDETGTRLEVIKVRGGRPVRLTRSYLL